MRKEKAESFSKKFGKGRMRNFNKSLGQGVSEEKIGVTNLVDR